MNYDTFRTLILCIELLLPTVLSAQKLDSLRTNQLTVRCVQYGIGHSNILDTYLSTQEYKGIDFRTSRETMRMTNIGKGNVSVQNFLQADFSFGKNRVDNNNTLAGMVNWNYGLHYQFKLSDNFKLLAGGLGDTNLGFIYNLRNSNNPASLRAYINLDASAMAIWHFHIKKKAFVLRYQLNTPILGVMFSPEMGESYYEIFSLGHYSGTIKLTSLHNQPSLRQFLSLDIPIGQQQIRLTYLGDLQQSHVNNIKTHYYSNVFMVGFVKRLYKLSNKELQKLPTSIQAY
ncbi:MAG: DUF3316 domain-containing protein [Bacteroidales bacterium]|nr:DUF3316 domain-containing protein [Bacteroidales bacterium]